MAVGAVADVVLQDDVARALVRIERPSAVVGLHHVVDEVAPHDGARLHAQQVDATHVREQPLADGVDMVLLDEVVMADTGTVAPHPTDRDATVEEVVDVVVGDDIAGRVHAQHADGAVEDAPGLMDVVVGNAIPAGAPALGLAGRRAVDLDPAGAQVAEFAAHHADAAAAVGEEQPVPADVADGAFLEGAVAGVLEMDDAGDIGRSLTGRGAVAAIEPLHRRVRQQILAGARLLTGMAPVGVLEGDAAEAHILHRSGLAAHQAQQLQGLGRHDLAALRGFAGQRQVDELAGGTVQVPLTGVGQRLGHVVKVVVGQLPAEGADHVAATATAQSDQAGRRIEGGDGAALLNPEVHIHDLDVREVAEGLHVPLGAGELGVATTAPARG